MGTNPTNFLLHTFFLTLLAFTHFINYQTATAAAAAFFEIRSLSSSSSSSWCNGSIAECNEELEMEMESEMGRRFLEDRRQISYRALNPNQPVCQGASGQAYSAGQCVPRSSNPYRRGCSPTYGCRNEA